MLRFLGIGKEACKGMSPKSEIKILKNAIIDK